MCDKLTSKDMSISYAEVPTALYKNATPTVTGKRRNEDELKNPIEKKVKKTQSAAKIHPKLKEKIFDPIMRQNPSYSFTS